MTHADPHTPAADVPRLQYPALQAEDYLPILRGLSVIAWIALAGMAGLEIWVRATPGLIWPHMGGFSMAYHLVMGEFAGATLMFSLMITHRRWFERAPRAASAKLRQLLWIMLAWLALHYFGLLHLTGGLDSPLLLLLPSVVIAAYLSLPAQEATRMAGGLVGGLIALVALENAALISPEGALAATFRTPGHHTTPILIALLLALLLAIVMGRRAREEFYAFNLALHRGPLCDPLTRLFTRDTLMQRLETELARARDQKTPTSILLAEIRNLEQIVTNHGFDVSARVLQHLAVAVAASIRDHMDTPARFGPKTLAILLPTLPQDSAQTVAKRIFESWQTSGAAQLGVSIELGLGMAVTNTPESTTIEQLLAGAEGALTTAASLPAGTVPVDVV